jgi:hypothetical protein
MEQLQHMRAEVEKSVQLLGCRLDDPKGNFWQQQEIFLFFKASRTVQGPTQPPVK